MQHEKDIPCASHYRSGSIPYALHILENYAMYQEELRIERANNGIIDL